MLRRLIINLIFAIVVASSNLSVTFGDDIEKCLSNKTYYSHIYNYKYISLGKFNICRMCIYDDRIPKGCELEFSNNDMDNVVKIINILNQVTYVEDQPNPAVAFEYGGNCQAITLLAHSYFNKANIKNNIVVTRNHMYNTIEINGKLYKVDITNSIFIEGGQNEKSGKDK